MRPKSFVRHLQLWWRGGPGVWAITDLGFYRYFKTEAARNRWLATHPGYPAIPGNR